MTPTVQDETANNCDDSPADGIQGDHADQQECEHHQGCAALTFALSPGDHNSGNADQKCNGEDHSAGLGEPKPVTEPSPIASKPRHAGSLGRGTNPTEVAGTALSVRLACLLFGRGGTGSRQRRCVDGLVTAWSSPRSGGTGHVSVLLPRLQRDRRFGRHRQRGDQQPGDRVRVRARPRACDRGARTDLRRSLQPRRVPRPRLGAEVPAQGADPVLGGAARRGLRRRSRGRGGVLGASRSTSSTLLPVSASRTGARSCWS